MSFSKAAIVHPLPTLSPPEGKTEGRRGRGRPSVTWTKNIKGWLEHTYNGCVRRAEGRSEQLEIHDRRPTTSRWHLMMIIPLSHPLAYPKRVTFPGIACHAYRGPETKNRKVVWNGSSRMSDVVFRFSLNFYLSSSRVYFIWIRCRMADSGGKTIDEIDDLFELVNHMSMLGIKCKGLGLNTLKELKDHAKQELSKRKETQGLSAGKVWMLKYYISS